MIDFKTLVEVLTNRSSLLAGDITISQEYLTKRIQSEILPSPHIFGIDVKLGHQQLYLKVDVGKAGLRYEYTTPFVLRAADLNSVNRYITFQQGREKVRPANLAAKLVPFAAMLIPNLGMLLEKIVKVLIRKIAEHVVSQSVTGQLTNFGQEANGMWRIGIGDSALPNILKEPVNIPGLGPRRILGEIIVFRRLDLLHGNAVIKLGLHPEIQPYVQMAASTASSMAKFLPKNTDLIPDLSKLAPLAPLLENSKAGPNVTGTSMFDGMLSYLPVKAMARRAFDVAFPDDSSNVDSDWLSEIADTSFAAPFDFDFGGDWLDILDFA